MHTFDTLAADGDSAALAWQPGVGTIDVDGTIGGGTLTLKFKRTGGSSYKTLGTATTFTAVGSANFELHMEGELIVSLASATDPSLSVAISRKAGIYNVGN